MAKLAAIQLDLDLSGAALEGELTGLTFNARQQIIQVDDLSAVGPERVQGNYDWSVSLEGTWDGASGQGDSLLAALLGTTSGWAAVNPAGTTVSASAPIYDGAVLLESYRLKAGSRSGTAYTARLQGNGALLRAVDLSFVLDSQTFGVLDSNTLG